MPLRFVYRTADISALSCSLDSAEICIYQLFRYTNLKGIVLKSEVVNEVELANESELAK